MRPRWSHLVVELTAAAVWSLALITATGIVLLRADDMASAVHGVGVTVLLWPMGIALLAAEAGLRLLDDRELGDRPAPTIDRRHAGVLLTGTVVVTAAIVLLG